jgi:predicted SnoaL-like aldol condensation-catalyzing enzyme
MLANQPQTEDCMKTTSEQNKKLVLEAFDALFNKRDYAAAEKFWSPNYVQHSAQIEPGRAGLFNLVRSFPQGFRWEHSVIMAEGDLVMLHSRYSGSGAPRNLYRFSVNVTFSDGG